jgi:hypothetical protein
VLSIINRGAAAHQVVLHRRPFDFDARSIVSAHPPLSTYYHFRILTPSIPLHGMLALFFTARASHQHIRFNVRNRILMRTIEIFRSHMTQYISERGKW